MTLIENLSPTFFALSILVAATGFTITWFMDAITHAKLGASDITKRELHTHRVLIITSMLMEFSLLVMYWFPLEILPLFIAALLTRTAHEFIDELVWHTTRCTFFETMLHLIMWISVITKTGMMFIWGFFTQYKGLSELPFLFYVWGLLVVICMGLISLKEWNQKTIADSTPG